jgi:hypothetical protein
MERYRSPLTLYLKPYTLFYPLALYTMSSYVSWMDFRKTHCAWCKHRTEPMEVCAPCAKYRKYGLEIDEDLTMRAFCSICIHQNDDELSKYCMTNRFHQEDSGEDFECYRFCQY